jgi:putative DNA methylase
MLTFVAVLRDARQAMVTDSRLSGEHADAVATEIACWIDRIADFSCTLCTLKPGGERGVVHAFTRQAIPMTWDFAEANLFGTDSANALGLFEYLIAGIDAAESAGRIGDVTRGSATVLPWIDGSFDAVITDPPYYDNVPYADISDFFYVWLKRTIGQLYPEHFSGSGTPKKQEAVADASRHGSSKQKANQFYEEMMSQSLAEAHRVLKANGTLAVVYAHKTTLGWATLVDAFRRTGFTITEAWPLDTEMKSRLRGLDSAALASSIFLVGRKREGQMSGAYETDVFPELEAIVRERVETLWEQGISGADLVIACVGAGLRAFTRFARVEYVNGEEVPAKNFLAEVETVVLDTILARLSKEVGGRRSLAGVDPATRFYILWRYTYKNAELDAGEAIIFANGTHVELDGPSGLSSGARALIEKKKAKYRLLDFTERGDNDKLGMPDEGQAGNPVPLIDALHRTLWLMENEPRTLAEFLRDAEPNREQMRLVAQALAGPALKGSELASVSPSEEQSALAKLTANWRSVIEDNVITTVERTDRKRGQPRMFE